MDVKFVLYRNVLRVLLENLEDEDGSTRALVFGVLTEMLKQVKLIFTSLSSWGLTTVNV